MKQCADAAVARMVDAMADDRTKTMTMTMTHSEKSHIRRMKAWPYRQECRGHDSTKKNLFTDEACSLARCAGTNCYGQSVMHRDLR